MPEDPQDPDIWRRFTAQLKSSADASTYDVWLSPLRFGGFDGRTLSVAAPAEHRAWIAARFMDLLAGAADDALGECRVELVDDSARHEAPRQAGAALEWRAECALNPRLTFDRFVIGQANRFGHAAALAVAEAPGAAYNPLFIYGPPGVGKTHLLHAIGNYVNAFGGGLKVHYGTAETFTNEFVGALRAKSIEHFKGRYRSNDVLLIDDIQFIQDKAQTEEEFFHTFNALYNGGAQIVLTCDRAPDDLQGLTERLRARFASGLLVDIEGPDPATRQLVLRKRVLDDRLSIADEEVLHFIAGRVRQSVRALEGALIRVAAYASLQGRGIDLALAAEVLDRLYPDSTKPDRRASIEVIQRIVCEEFGLERAELISGNRSARLSWPRQIAMYLCREHTSQTLPAIGRAFGGRDHTTVMYAHRKASEVLAQDPEQRELVRRLTEQITGDPHDRRD